MKTDSGFCLYQKSWPYVGKWIPTGTLDSQALPHMSNILDEVMASLECEGEEGEGERGEREVAMVDGAVVDDGEAYRMLAKQIHRLMDSVPLKGNGKCTTETFIP